MTTISVQGQTNQRSMLVYAPTGIAQNRPLLISMHGLNQDIAYQKGQAKWEQVADTAKFVVVYPQGENNSWDIDGNKDIDFILAIIESMVTRYGIDRGRVYLSGFSMGGMMTYHAASHIDDKIAAFAPVSSMLFNSIHTNSRPIPFIHTHGDADPVFPYDQSLLDYFAGWRTKLKCPTTAVVTKPNSGVTISRWAPCDCNMEYVLVTLAGKGHWHSIDANWNTSIGIWNFVKKYTNNPTCVTKVRGPFNGVIHPIPGAIQAEEFDVGGNGVAYYDDSPGSATGVAYRSDEDVDIEVCTDAGGGYNLGYATSGEWLEYTVDVAYAGNYKLDLRVASNGDGRTLSFTMDGTPVATNVAIPNTEGWQTWVTTSVNSVSLTAGKHILRMIIGSTSYVNVNYIAFSSVVTGLEDVSMQSDLSAFPNPFENTIQLNKEGKFGYKLYDISGRLLLQGQGQGETVIGGTLQGGLYLLEVTSDTGSQLIKIHKK
jgi:poly(3-hydroxybutyrate) depolymerase